MERVALSPDVSLSRIVYGMWRLAADADTSPANIEAKVEACLAQGVTTIDHADIYGGYTAEGLFGRMLKARPSLRDKIEIVTKCDIVVPAGRYANVRSKHYDTSAVHIEKSVEWSLKELSTDRIDLLLIHRPDPLMDHRDTGPALDRLVKSGKARAVGVSNFRPHDFSLLQSAMETRLATNQIEVSLLASQAFTNGDVAYLQERNVPIMAWSPLGGGRLFASENGALADRLAELGRASGVDAGAVAIAWLLYHPARILPVMGTNALERIVQFADALKFPMDRVTWFELYQLAMGEDIP